MTARETAALKIVAQKLSVPAQWLYNAIRHESGFNPQSKNPRSSARGLLQFIDSTARQLGYKNSTDLINKNPTIEKQLTGPVYQYLNRFKPFATEQAFYMSVFYPAARAWEPARQFPAAVTTANPGIYRVQDYLDRVRGKTAAAIGGGMILLAAAIGAALFFGKKNKSLYIHGKNMKEYNNYLSRFYGEGTAAEDLPPKKLVYTETEIQGAIRHALTTHGIYTTNEGELE